jgi:phage terminase large subunit-like protein
MLASAKSIYGHLASALADDWSLKARPEQLAPSGDWWSVWLLLAGRGFGKTRAGTGWVRQQKLAGCGRIALIAPTAADCRDVLVEGPSGILATSPNHDRPIYESSKRRIVWNNGAIATTYSAEEAERLRGPEHDAAYCDELGAWPDPSVWDMLMFGLRIGANPRACVTTTPKPTKLIRQLVARENKDVAITRGRTSDNAANLSPVFLSQIVSKYQGTRLGRQELNAELLFDFPGALWTREMLERANEKCHLPDMKRVVVAVDPSGTRGQEDGGDSVGIVVAGLGVDGLGYVLADRTCKLSPDGWGRAAVNAYREFKADRIVAERNFGGAMVEHVIRTVDSNVSYREVTASRGKIARAEPIAALYEQRRVRHHGSFIELEDQMAAMTSDGYSGDGSPDRCDALVWALSELMTKAQQGQTIIGFYSSDGIRLLNPPPKKTFFPDDPNDPLAGFVTTAM